MFGCDTVKMRMQVIVNVIQLTVVLWPCSTLPTISFFSTSATSQRKLRSSAKKIAECIDFIFFRPDSPGVCLPSVISWKQLNCALILIYVSSILLPGFLSVTSCHAAPQFHKLLICQKESLQQCQGGVIFYDCTIKFQSSVLVDHLKIFIFW